MSATIPEYEIAWAGAALVFAVLGARALDRASRRHGEPAGLVLRVAPACATLLALVGARVHALMGDPVALWQRLIDGRLLEVVVAGGQRITGGLLLAAVFLTLIVPRACGRRLGAGEILDALVPATGLALAIGRVGCLLAGCCFGVPTDTPLAIEYPSDSPAYWNHVAQGRIEGERASLAVHPLALYLGASALLAALLARKLVGRRKWHPGATAMAFAVLLSAFRLVLEPLREVRFLGAVPGQQALSGLILCVGLGLLLACWMHPAPPGNHGLAKGGAPSRPGTPSL